MAASELAAALAKLQTQLPHIKKAAAGTIRNGKPDRYADLADVTKAVVPTMAGLGLAFASRPTMTEHGFVLAYDLMHVSGDSIGGSYPLPASGSPQQIGSAITYARRYCLCAVTGVAPDDDDDDAAAAEAAPRYRSAHADAEHARLLQAPVEDHGRSVHGPVDVTEFPEASGLPKEDQPGSVSPAQVRAIQMIMTRRSKDRDDRLAQVSALVGRDVASVGDLSWQEAARLLTDLDERAKEGAR